MKARIVGDKQAIVKGSCHEAENKSNPISDQADLISFYYHTGSYLGSTKHEYNAEQLTVTFTVSYLFTE